MKRLLIIITTGALVVAAVATQISGAASSPAAPSPFMSYTAPTGPEMTPGAAAEAALRFAREAHEPGEVKMTLAHGTEAQAEALAEGKTVAAGKKREAMLAAPPSSTFCFGGQNSPCTMAEQEQAKAVLLAEAQTPSYIATLTGKSFAPAEHLRKGAHAVTGNKMIVVFDAHTGRQSGLTIGTNAPTPKASELAPVSMFVSSSTEAVAQVASQAPKDGVIQGTIRGANRVVVFKGKRDVWARARAHHGEFKVGAIYPGAYSIAGQHAGRYCGVKRIVVSRRRTTVVHLTCAH